MFTFADTKLLERSMSLAFMYHFWYWFILSFQDVFHKAGIIFLTSLSFSHHFNMRMTIVLVFLLQVLIANWTNKVFSFGLFLRFDGNKKGLKCCSNFFWLAKNLLKMKIFGLANFQTFFKKTCTNNPTSEIQIAPFLKKKVLVSEKKVSAPIPIPKLDLGFGSRY